MGWQMAQPIRLDRQYHKRCREHRIEGTFRTAFEDSGFYGQEVRATNASRQAKLDQ
jgi:hypothetical protein